jgi:hypothetical protein
MSLSASLCQSIVFKLTQHHHGCFAANSMIVAAVNKPHCSCTFFKELLVPQAIKTDRFCLFFDLLLAKFQIGAFLLFK